MIDSTVAENETLERMSHGDGTDLFGSQRPETPPWDASEYSQLISAGPLLPLLEQYAGIGMMHEKQKKKNICHVRDDEDDILLMSHTVIFCRFL